MPTPQKISRLLIKALKRDALQLVQRVLAPRVFTVHLSKPFMTRWEILIPQLEKELADHICGTAKKSGLYEISGTIEVHLVLNRELKPGKCLIETSFAGCQSPKAALVTLEGLEKELSYPLISPVTVIGRGRVDLPLPPEKTFISRRHARIRMEQRRFVISDMQSRLGTFVNGRRIDEIQLVPGDLISIGDVVFSFRG
ncbi:FhaA domain-containing protein [Dethiosulfatarculus sandiegensis]|uniref:FHA domain-containing protein n=1 Tax=Dethiosulfatarculus sandiegensis TaxID=1429043 RepID=A0A0D2G8D2_9BACT|nr:FhaA domain-containing protein [Dethiosulfatarculus sandiegensis]KIX11207.1 hypothetical protein X474_25425 [Dethiosulfatarculus sandiegensis]